MTDVTGNKKKGLLFCSIRLNKISDYKNVLMNADETVCKAEPIRRSQIRKILKSFVPKSRYLEVVHKDTLYVVCPVLKDFSYAVVKTNRAFHALFKITEAMLFNFEDMTLFKFCDLCRSSYFFKRNLVDSREWKSWCKPVLVLLNRYWVDRFWLELNLGDAKWLGAVAQRTKRLPENVVEEGEGGGEGEGEEGEEGERREDDVPECEVLLSREGAIGIMYNTESNRVTYVSPMFVSRDAFAENLRDTSNVCCQRWTMLYVNKDYWLSRGLEYYVPRFAHVPGSIVRYFKTNGVQNDKHKYMYENLLILQRLLKK
jgi:hypothetical protein